MIEIKLRTGTTANEAFEKATKIFYANKGNIPVTFRFNDRLIIILRDGPLFDQPPERSTEEQK